VRTRFGVDSRALTAALALLTHVPGAARVPTGVHALGSDAWVVLARCGTARRWARGRGQSRVTARLTAWATTLTEDLEPGVHHLHEVARLADLPADLGLTTGTG
jgi:hypothetical protein